MNSDLIKVESDGKTRIVRLNRPSAMNAFNRAMSEEFRACLEELNQDPSVRAVVLTGVGERAFCAGADLKEMGGFTSKDEITAALGRTKKFYEEIRNLGKPLIVALNGVAAGTGFQIALMADARIAHPGVRMCQPEVNSGIPSVTGSMLMAHSLGRAVALDMALTGRFMWADEGHRLGLIQEVVPAEEVLKRAVSRAQDLAAKSPLAIQATRLWFTTSTKAEFDAAFDAAAEGQLECFSAGQMKGKLIGQPGERLT